MFLQAEEDVDPHLNWAGCWGTRSEVRDGLASDGVLLVFQGEDDLSDMLKLIDWGVGGEEDVADKGHEFEKGAELDGPVMAGELVVISGMQAEVESQDNQFGDVPGFLVVG